MATSDDLLLKLRKGDSRALAKAITLVESTLKGDLDKKLALLSALKPDPKKKSLRIALSGIPGVGKSSLIEALGGYLLEKDPKLKIGILSVDPASAIGHGSILADKTRMPVLARSERVFIRPSSSAGSFGGLAAHSRECIFLMEEAGYDLIIVETLGVGQTEYLAAYLVDILALVLMPHTGDDLQSLKKGVSEFSDILIINKADGLLKDAALAARASYSHYFNQAYGLNVPIQLTSVTKKEGISELAELFLQMAGKRQETGEFARKRQNQDLANFRLDFRSAFALYLAESGYEEKLLHKQNSTIKEKPFLSKVLAQRAVLGLMQKLDQGP